MQKCIVIIPKTTTRRDAYFSACYNRLMLSDALGDLLVTNLGLDKKKPLLIGVSGGPDSLCLLDVLHKANYQLIVAHFDHKLRPTSGLEADRVADEARQRGLQFVLGSQDVSQFAVQEKLSIEEAARIARYRFMFGKASLLKAQAVVVGHNVDDQVETVLMHFLRGSGLDGLGGMQVYALPNLWSNKIPLIRPLLGVWRSEIEAYCREGHLEPIRDETNDQPTYFRNRLRHVLIPELESYNPQFKQRVSNMADVIRQDAALLDEVCETAWKECVVSGNEKWIMINRSTFNAKHLAVRRLLLRKALNLLAPDIRDVDFAVIERGVKFIEKPSNGRKIDLVAGYVVESWFGDILLHPAEFYPEGDSFPQMDGGEIIVHHPGIVKLGKGWQLTVGDRTIDDNVEGLIPTDAFSVWLDAEEVPLPLAIRPVKAGERLNPLGMGSSTQKVSDVFINAQIPAVYRSAWPLVFTQERLAWMPGIRPAEFCRIKESTRKVLTLRVEKVTH